MLPDTISALYRDLRDKLDVAGITNADHEARYIIEKRLNLDWGDLIAHGDRTISSEQITVIAQDLENRLSSKPLGRIYGEREFYGLSFKLGDETLEPRPDTEVLVDIALKRFKERGVEPESILDLGTGTGCILITLLHHWHASHGTGVDIASGALAVAQENANHHGVSRRCSWIQSDWCENVTGQFDLIVSNPPYISNQIIGNLAPEVVNHDPILALDGGEDGLQAYKKLFLQISSLLKTDGIALFEIGYDQAEDVLRLAEESGFSCKHVHPDLAGKPRVVEISSGDK